jgi:hypothetical protein
MKKRFRLTIIELWLLLIMFGAVILTVWPQLEIVKASQYKQECVANLISIMMAVRLYEAKEEVAYKQYTAKELVTKGYLSQELYCPASGVSYKIDPDVDLAICPSGRPGHSWPIEK